MRTLRTHLQDTRRCCPYSTRCCRMRPPRRGTCCSQATACRRDTTAHVVIDCSVDRYMLVDRPHHRPTHLAHARTELVFVARAGSESTHHRRRPVDARRLCVCKTSTRAHVDHTYLIATRVRRVTLLNALSHAVAVSSITPPQQSHRDHDARTHPHTAAGDGAGVGVKLIVLSGCTSQCTR
jgi:hypothetical protein